MKPDVVRDLLRRLEAEGYDPIEREGVVVHVAPNGSTSLDPKELEAEPLGTFFDKMVTQREKLEHMHGVMPEQRHKLRASIEDVATVVDVLAAMIDERFDRD